jgi:DNA gyrase/topoisomerase IV subunit A
MHRINRRLKKLDLQNKQTTLSSSGPVEQEITAFQGVVAEVRESVVLVLTPNGELLRVVVTDLPKIGQTLSGVVFDKIKDTVDNHLETFFVTTETSVLEVQQDETIYNIGDEFVGEVVDIQTSSVLVMTPDFDFIEVDTNGQMYEVGEEIVFY